MYLHNLTWQPLPCSLFTFSIGAAICDILPVSSLYSHDDTDMMTFVIMFMLTTVVRSAVTEEDWLSFCNTLKRTLERPADAPIGRAHACVRST